MHEIKNEMIRTVQEKHGDIYPCGECKTLHDSFTFDENEVLFWFNTKDNNTHIYKRVLI